MRLTILMTLLASLAGLSACGVGVGSTDSVPSLDAVCAEQSAMAQDGRTDGRLISITCP